MDASKVTIQLQNPVLSGGRKRKLRIKAVTEYINSVPYGTPISAKNIAEIANFPNPANASTWFSRQIKAGIFDRHEINRFQAFYTVPGAIKTTPAVKEVEQENLPVDKPVKEKVMPEPVVPEVRVYTFAELEALAIKFVFYRGSTRFVPDFLEWLKEQ